MAPTALPLSSLAGVANTSTDALKARLQTAGIAVTSDSQSVRDPVGPDPRRQVEVVIELFQAASG